MKILKLLICVVLLLIGIWIGFTTKNFPFIQWNKEVKIYEAFQVFVTLFVGLVIPFFIKKWIDDSRAVKVLLVDESKEIIAEVRKIKELLSDCYKKKQITSEDKQYVLYLLSLTENLLQNYGSNLHLHFGSQTITDYNSLVDAYNSYESNLTKDDFMADSFTQVSLEFVQNHDIELNLLIAEIRSVSVKMQRL